MWQFSPPSYRILSEIFDDFFIPKINKKIEARDWTKQDISALMVDLEDSQKFGRKILLGGVFNGKLSEGIDYSGGVLDAVVCVGIPNPSSFCFPDCICRLHKRKIRKTELLEGRKLSTCNQFYSTSNGQTYQGNW